MKRSQQTVEVKSLVHCEWNPRTDADYLEDNENMVKLVASVRAMGIIQPIVVWARDGENIVIAGNRRMAAAKIAGIDNVPSIVFEGITLAQAQEITRVENEVRLGVDPIADSGLIWSMLKLGYSQKEIAAHFGVSEATICRRAKLIDLDPLIKAAAVEHRRNITTDSLERIALFPADIQKKLSRHVVETINRCWKSRSEAHWELFKWEFSRVTNDLSVAKFDTTGCSSCFNRTGVQPDLWGSVGKKSELGCCLDCECFKRKINERIEERVREKVGRECEIISLEIADVDEWQISEKYDEIFSRKRSKKRPVCWYSFNSYSDEIHIYWGVSQEDFDKFCKDLEQKELADEAEIKKIREDRNRRYSEWKEKKEEITRSRRPIEETFNDAIEKIDACVKGDCKSVFERAIKDVVFKKNKNSSVLAKMMIAGFDEYMFENENPDRLIVIIDEYPEIAKRLKIKDDDLKSAREALSALVEFDKNNPVPEFEEE